MVVWSAVFPVGSRPYRPDVHHDQTWVYLLWTFKYGFKEGKPCEIQTMVLPAYHHDLSRADFFILSLLVMIMIISRRPNQALLPTTMSVTDCADAHSAPDTLAADL